MLEITEASVYKVLRQRCIPTFSKTDYEGGLRELYWKYSTVSGITGDVQMLSSYCEGS
jgi:hypothetical protein